MIDPRIDFIITYIPHLCFVTIVIIYYFILVSRMKKPKIEPYSDFTQSLTRCGNYALQMYDSTITNKHSEFLNHVKREPFTPIFYLKDTILPQDLDLMRHPFFDLYRYLRFPISENDEHFRTIVNTYGVYPSYTTFGNNVTMIRMSNNKFVYICLRIENKIHLVKYTPASSFSYNSYWYKLYLEIDKLCQTK